MLDMDNLEYIDSYFDGEPSPEETGRFESRINDDPAFANEVQNSSKRSGRF